MHNTKFSYLYRDGSNYKKWADVVFSNPEGLRPEVLTGALESAFGKDGLFIAHQVRVPEVFLYSKEDITADDHCFHEFALIERTAEMPNDRYGRSIAQFLAEVMSEANRGWLAFDPLEKLPR